LILLINMQFLALYQKVPRKGRVQHILKHKSFIIPNVVACMFGSRAVARPGEGAQSWSATAGGSAGLAARAADDLAPNFSRLG
jgi:hypothetical protein